MNRRCRRQPRDVHAPTCAVECWWVHGTSDPEVASVEKLGDLSGALLPASSSLASWRNKCLQDVVLSLAQGRDRERLRCTLGVLCRNHAPTGGWGSRESDSNLWSVQHALRLIGACVRVFGARDEASFAAHRFRGWWPLGDAGGRCLGGLVWFEEQGHACALGGDLGSRIMRQMPFRSQGVEPWAFFPVGGPKKKGSRRGAHLRGQGNEVVMRGVAAKAQAQPAAVRAQGPVAGGAADSVAGGAGEAAFGQCGCRGWRC